MATDDKVSVILTSTDAGGSVKQKSFTYISPDATNGQLKSFAQAANALTNNSYNGSRKVVQTDLDSADPGQAATITLSPSSVDLATLKSSLTSSSRMYVVTATYNGDGQLYAFVEGNMKYLGVSAFENNNDGTYSFRLLSASDDAVNLLTAPITIKVYADATNNYTAAEATFTVTA